MIDLKKARTVIAKAYGLPVSQLTSDMVIQEIENLKRKAKKRTCDDKDEILCAVLRIDETTD